MLAPLDFKGIPHLPLGIFQVLIPQRGDCHWRYSALLPSYPALRITRALPHLIVTNCFYLFLVTIPSTFSLFQLDCRLLTEGCLFYPSRLFFLTEG
jgi:hypothetical protein